MTSKFSVSARERKIAAFLLILICISVVYSYGVRPLNGRAEFLDRKIALEQGRLQKSAAIIRKAEDFEQKYKNILEEYEQKSSDEEAMAGILSQIEAVGNRISIRLADLKPQRVRKIDFYNRFSVSLTVEGKIPDIMLFVYTLQRPPYGFYAEEFQLRKKSAMAQESECNLILAKIFIP